MCKNVLCSYGYCVDGKCECDPRFPYCKKNSKCKDFKCENGGTCIDVIVDDGTVSECLCPPGLTVRINFKKLLVKVDLMKKLIFRVQNVKRLIFVKILLVLMCAEILKDVRHSIKTIYAIAKFLL